MARGGQREFPKQRPPKPAEASHLPKMVVSKTKMLLKPRFVVRARTACMPLLFLAAMPVCQLRADVVDAAASRGIAYLIKEQDVRGAVRENGAHETAMTALFLLAAAAVGNLPADLTPEGVAVRKALDFLVSPGRQDVDGYFGARDGSRMYGHGITTLALSALLGMGVSAEQDAQVRTACEKAVQLILRAQALQKRPGHEGGWRYSPTSTDSDLSVSIWQLMALRSAKNAGVQVPKEAIDSAVAYIKGSHVPAGANWSAPAGFRYVAGGAPAWSTAAEGLLALQVCGEYEAKEVISAADWLFHNPPDATKAKTQWFYYGTYYYAQGMYQRGGEHSEVSAKKLSEVLLPLQEADGSWRPVSDMERNRVYCTALALLSLSVKYHYLPIYQR